jgi:1,2-phenylacetyl-CoA epoxidase PaaB subunit
VPDEAVVAWIVRAVTVFSGEPSGRGRTEEKLRQRREAAAHKRGQIRVPSSHFLGASKILKPNL